VDSGLPPRAGASLVEREQELAAIDTTLEAARSGSGGLLLIEGPAGIGKTSLMREARRVADDAQMTVLGGVGTEFEREYPFGVVRQAFSHLLVSEAARARRFIGAARLAEPALLDTGEDVDAAPFGILNGLYWFLAQLAEENPVLLAIDDGHWADEPSLHFAGFLARRLESMPIALIVGARTEADFSTPPPGLAEVREHARANGVRLEPRTLDPEGVAQVLREFGGEDADPDFSAACHRATGGNPFLLDELLRALAELGLAFESANAGRVAELSSPSLTRTLNAALERLGEASRALARAVAVLGEGTSLDLAAELASVDGGAATGAAAELVEAAILTDAPELSFRHPILASAVREGLSARERASAHERAAQILRGRGAPAERVALQVLHVPPGRDKRVIAELRLAARHARERGAPATAAMLLTRALAEQPDECDQSELLLELGRAELDEGKLPEAGEHFYAAHQSSTDPGVRGRAAAMLVLAVPGDPAARERIGDVVRATLPEVEPLDREMALRLRSVLVLEGAPVEDEGLEGNTVAEAVYLGTLVFPRMDSTAHADEITDIAQRGARQADALLEEGAIALGFTGIVLGLRWSDRLDEAEQLASRAIEVARRRGSTADFAMAMTLRANVHRRAGRLREAEADARSALPAVLDDRWMFARGVQPLALSLLDQGDPKGAARELAAVTGGMEELPDSPPMIPVVLMRMAVRAACRDFENALADWNDALRRANRVRGPNAGWIEDLAVAAGIHHALGDVEAARQTAWEALEMATAWGTPGGIGQALLAQARVGASDDEEQTLRDAEAHLSESPVRLEYARALAALGGLLRRQGRRVESREPLREAYELAQKCGAEGLAEDVRAELRASGVRLKPEARSGGDSLTPSERRIADMAAEGLSNAEIAQELFLTVKTVEMHLTQTYRKLEISGRRQLSQALKSPV
jgi:DNA-binding CsgD family transcriptional regulator